ncbi:MAG TPA: PepSY domain-containing protein [Gemmatimonadales bacterium]|nr:PepSY domain-containing protein [Gemmatimonadales bacterium]
MSIVTKLAALAALVAIAGAAQAQRPTYKREVPPRLLRQTKVSEDSALKVAQARIPTGTVKALELENEKGNLIWSFEFTVPNRPGIYEVNVNAVSGALVGGVEHEMPDTTHRAAPKPKP